MDPFSMAELLLPGIRLTPGQLAQLRALNTKYFTELAALQRKAEAESVAPGAATGSLADRRADVPPAPPAADVAELDAMIARDIRDMLTDEQRAVLDRNLPRLRERPVERPVGVDRTGGAPSAPASPGTARGPEPESPPRGPAPDHH